MVEAKGTTEIGTGLLIYIVTYQQITWQPPGNPLTTHQGVAGGQELPTHKKVGWKKSHAERRWGGTKSFDVYLTWVSYVLVILRQKVSTPLNGGL